MKRNIFIRILCLLLCISMLLPFGAAATVLEEISVDGWGNDGLTTNEMAYVDQFYKGSAEKYGSSYLSSEGYALKRWLSNESQGGRNRVDSGYLMLDEEVSKNSSKKLGANGDLEKNDGSGWHMFKEFNARFLGPVADYFASGGASIAVALIEEGAFRLKFKWAGKSAYPYYAQLQQVYYEYVANLQNELEKVDDSFGQLAKMVESVAKLPDDVVYIKTGTDTWFFGGRGKAKGLSYDIIDVVDMNQLRVKVQYIKDGKIKTRDETLSKLLQSPANVNEVISVRNKIEDETLRNLLDTEINKKVKSYTTKTGNIKEELFGLPYEHINGVCSTVEESDLDDKFKRVESIDISEDLKNTEDFAKKIGLINNILQSMESSVNVTAQQKSYMNALTNMSQYYLNMLCQWYQDVDSYEVPFGYGHVQRDIKDAIKALIQDVLDLQTAGLQELSSTVKSVGMGVVYNSGQFASILLDWLELKGWTGIKDLFKMTELFGNEKVASRVSGVAAIGSMALSLITSDFLEFEDKADTIYNLKWSLDELLTNKENGLLLQYAQNRNHETACEIIRALDTMKILKLMGENLIEEYYLCDFYDSLGVDVSSAAHLVLRNEMAKRTDKDRLDASDSFTPIIGVYKYFEYSDTTSDGETLIWADYVLMDYYLKNASKQAVYNGKTLTTLPSAYAGATSKKPSPPFPYMLFDSSYQDYDAYIQYIHDRDRFDVDKSIELQKEILYKDDKMQIYSDNGLDVLLTGDDSDQYMKLEKEINKLLNKYDDVNDIFWRQWEQQDHSKKEENRIEKEQDLHERLQWTITTRGWIEAIDMYDSSIDYIELKKAGY